VAFDNKQGRGSARAGAGALFPEFVQDVVWKHALCTVK